MEIVIEEIVKKLEELEERKKMQEMKEAKMIDEAIKHCEEVVEQKDLESGFDTDNERYTMTDNERADCKECANEHRQLAEWLKDYKRLLNQQTCKDAINRQVIKEQMIEYGFRAPDMTVTEFVEDLLPVALKSVTVTDSVDKFKEIDFKTIKNGKFVNDKE